MQMILHYWLVNTAQWGLFGNTIIFVPGLLETGKLSTLIEQNKLFSIGLPLGISIFRLPCQTLNELPKVHYLELTSPLLSQLLRT